MGRGIATVGAVAFLTCALASTGHAAVSDWIDVAAVEERLLGDVNQATHGKDLLAFTRRLGTGGIVTGTLADSLDAAGAPASTTLEALRALGTALDLDKDIHTGDRFYLRHEQTFTLAGNRIGVGRVLWLEVATRTKGTVAVHRFQPKDGVEQFWLANGQAAALPAFRQPLDIIKVTSGFGLRADPLDHPSSNVTPAVVEVVTPPPPPPAPPQEIEASLEKLRAASRAYAGFDTASVASARDGGGMNAIELDRIMATARRMRALEAEKHRREEAVAAAQAAAVAPPKVEPPPAEPVKRRLFMHEGVDLLANTGTPIHAAADGVVVNAGPNGGYGNFIRLSHAGKLTTIYGHLSRLAPDLQVGQPVLRGEVIGFVGSTGRSTGAHLHFEIQSNGRPVDPASHPAMRCAQLAGADLVAFKKQVAAALAERQRESRL
jgi:murein DD-endopeptidase MepM/ murein hydrolase activator NlpD